MIEIKTVHKKSKDHFVLVINGNEISDKDCRVQLLEQLLWISISNFDVYEMMWPYSLSQVLLSDTAFPDIEIHVSQIDFEFIDETSSLILHKSNQGNYEIGFDLGLDFDNWKQVWSVQEYVRELRKSIEAATEHTIRWQQSDPDGLFNGYIIYFSVTDPEANVVDVISDFGSVVDELQEEAILTLQTRFRTVESGVDNDAVVVNFDFPEEVKIPCEQYLLYFVQFLKDLGVDSTADLQHKAGQVLFSVTPDNKEQALDKIREALAIYVQLPTSPILDASIFGVGEIHIQQLVANVQHLKGQLMLASAVLQAKDATIQAQQQLINQQQRFSSGEVLPSSILDVSMRKDINGKEELLGGLVALTKYEGKGFEVNLAEMFRRLRSWFAER